MDASADPAAPPVRSAEPTGLRALRAVAAAEGVPFVVLVVCSVLKRTTSTDLVPVLGPVHGVLFVALVVLVLAQLRVLRWGPVFTVVILTVGGPGAHFAVHATRPDAAARRPA